ncbi:hypothetical protein GCM10029992_37570 [Glycomyces albus]
MSTFHTLGAGRLRVSYEPNGPQGPVTIGLEDPVTGHRLTLHQLPDDRHAALVAVPTESGTGEQTAAEVVIGAGRVRANRPAPGLGPADRIGLEAEPGKTAWRTRALERLDGHLVRLEAHEPDHQAASVPPIPRQRTAPERRPRNDRPRARVAR